MKRRVAGAALAAMLLVLLCGCGQDGAGPAEEQPKWDYNPVFTEDDLDGSWSEEGATEITFDGERVDIRGGGAEDTGSGVLITKGGCYVLSGSSGNSRVAVKVDPSVSLKLVLKGLDLTCQYSAPLYVANGCAVVILAEGTDNILTDAQVYDYGENGLTEEPNACVYDDDSLTVLGAGSLTVNGRFNNGIGTKDELRIAASGHVTVNAVNNAVKGNDCVLLRGCDLEIVSEADGIKTDDEQPDHGVVSIEDSTVTLRCGDDAIQAVSRVIIRGGGVTIDAEDQEINCDGQVFIS